MRLSDAEWKVMNVVWEHHPAAVREVLERLGSETSWAYSTVKTMLGRLVDKGALAVHKKGNTSLFEPLVSRHEARRSALRTLAERAFGGAFGSLVQHLLADDRLSAEERAELRSMLLAEREHLGTTPDDPEDSR
ncbi:MAG: BlaI/MecI/CopY family transcriptional regulator [Acidobacteriota bacterium]